MQKKLHIKKDDTVLVLAGSSKGKQGKVLTIDKTKNRAIVEGVNKVKKTTKPQSDKANPATGEATRIGRKLDKDNKLVRYSKKTGEEIK